MTDRPESTAPPPPALPRLYWLRFLAVSLAIGLGLALVLSRGHLGAFAAVFPRDAWSPHAPDWTPLIKAGAVVWTHVATVAAAFVIGLVLLWGPKGRRAHRALGWVFAGLMLVTAIDTLFIRTPGVGPHLFGLSPLHVFSFWTLGAAPLGVYFARRHNVARHRATMTSLFLGGLVLAGLFAFLPGRIMHAVVFG